jgi:F0F1-type ATP synthase assembly protein I
VGRENPYTLFARYSSIIFILPACLFVGFLIGSYLDDWLGTQPLLTVGLLLLGAVAGFVQVFRLLRADQ